MFMIRTIIADSQLGAVHTADPATDPAADPAAVALAAIADTPIPLTCAASPSIDRPQLPQKRLPASTGALHFGHLIFIFFPRFLGSYATDFVGAVPPDAAGICMILSGDNCCATAPSCEPKNSSRSCLGLRGIGVRPESGVHAL
jgi:hypothetical protein